MADVTVIGRNTRIRGRISGAVDLEVQGFLDGEVSVDGDVTVESTGLVSANISGRRLIVRGAVKGDLAGVDAIVLEDGARVVGDVRAPRVAITPGALVKGYVQTANAEGAPRSRSQSEASRSVPKAPASQTKVAATPARAIPAPPRSAPAVSAPSRNASAVSAPSRNASANSASSRTNHAPPAAARSAKAPPPPVVPALKKGAKGQIAKKK